VASTVGDVEIPALDVPALRDALGDTVARLDVVEVTGSTNADLAEAARAGAPDRSVLVAEHQAAGRGRLDRGWTSPPRAGITVSVLLRPTEVATNRLGWLSLLAGVALAHTVRGFGADASLKWPNDLLVGPHGAKCAGLLAELAEPGAVVLGIGLNVGNRPDQLPPGVNATSLLTEGVDVPRQELLVALLRRLLADVADWRAAGGDPEASGLASAYRQVCATLGTEVRIQQPAGPDLVGTALDVDGDGRLVLREAGGTTRAVAAGDVVHLRPAPR
jgi:BirA family transcriptional regulator, biotin operon repressor / biotin---[acetyl-CoA-carboxylase] ligase